MRFLDRDSFRALLDALVGRGYRLVGPTVSDGAIVLSEIDGVGDLPLGVGEEQGPGTYRLVDRGDERYFGFAHGPDSARRFLFPGRELLATARRVDGRLEFETPLAQEAPFAFVGLRSCDLHAVAVQDRVFMGGPALDGPYAHRRAPAFFIGVNCADPGGTCFCASMRTGPRCTTGFDLALTEISGGFLAEVGSTLGAEVLAEVPTREASVEAKREAREQEARATERMGRTLDTSDMRALLYSNRQHPRWAEVADRCLACGNCTSACPTCFCHDVVDAPDLTGASATRTREWATCFSEEFSHTAGGAVRTSREARYRQWLTHKFAGWIDQFGTSGCVGCGRCITWCPVGIDVTEEISAIRATDDSGGGAKLAEAAR